MQLVQTAIFYILNAAFIIYTMLFCSGYFKWSPFYNKETVLAIVFMIFNPVVWSIIITLFILNDFFLKPKRVHIILIGYMLTYLSMAFTIYIVESITRINFEGYVIAIAEMAFFTLLVLLVKIAIKFIEDWSNHDLRKLSILF